MELKDVVKSYIKESGVSLREFSRRAKLSPQTVSKITTGATTMPDIDTLNKLARAMHMNYYQLVQLVTPTTYSRANLASHTYLDMVLNDTKTPIASAPPIVPPISEENEDEELLKALKDFPGITLEQVKQDYEPSNFMKLVELTIELDDEDIIPIITIVETMYKDKLEKIRKDKEVAEKLAGRINEEN